MQTLIEHCDYERRISLTKFGESNSEFMTATPVYRFTSSTENQDSLGHFGQARLVLVMECIKIIQIPGNLLRERVAAELTRMTKPVWLTNAV